jgi:hypothetical protein
MIKTLISLILFLDRYMHNLRGKQSKDKYLTIKLEANANHWVKKIVDMSLHSSMALFMDGLDGLFPQKLPRD